MEKQKRIEWIDIAKGYGIILMVLGHSVRLGGGISRLIFGFHMPLFFLLSGIVYKDAPIAIVVRKRAKSLLIPYILFCILGFAVTIVVNGIPSLEDMISDIWYANPTSINISSIWFLICIFFVTIIFSALMKLKGKSIRIVVTVFIVVIGMLFGWGYNRGSIPYRLPFEIDVALVALGFYAFGFWTRNYILEFPIEISRAKKAGIWIIACVIYVILIKKNGYVNLRSLKYGNWVLYWLGALLGCLILISVAKWTTEQRWKSIITWLGKNSIYILGYQALFTRGVLYLINVVTGESYQIYGLPYSYAAISFVAVMTFSILLTIVTLYLKGRLIKLTGRIENGRQ